MLRIFCWALALSAALLRPAAAEDSLIDRMENLKSSLVQVKTVYAKVLHVQGVARLASFERSGSGIIIDPSGLIVTNTHVIINAPHIFVTFSDGARVEAQVAFVSQSGDFSFLRVQPPHALRAIPWAESSQARLGQEILGIGSSDFDDKSIMSGQVTNLVQSRSTGENELIGIDLSLYKGDSGGPILDRQGRLLGLVMAKEKSQERASFAIASDKIREQYLLYRQQHPS